MITSLFRGAGTVLIPDASRAFGGDAPLNSNVLTQRILLDLTGTLTIAGAAAIASLNDGSLMGAVEEVQVIDNGRPVVRMTGMELLAFNEHLRGPRPGSTRLTAFAAAAYPLREVVSVPFSWPDAIVPTEVGLRQRAPDTKLTVTIKLKSMDAEGTIVVNGVGGTATLSDVQAEVNQEAVFGNLLPVAIPEVLASQTVPINGVSANLRIPLDTPDTIRAILLYGSTANRGDVSDIITGVSLRTDQADFFGSSGKMPFRTLVDILADDAASSISSLGGFSAVAGASAGGVYALIDFQRLASGRLTQLLGKGFGTNLRFEVSAQPSGVAGATGSSVRALLYTVQRVPGITRDPVNAQGQPVRLIGS